MEEEESFLRDFFEIANKVLEIGGYMKSLVEIAMGRYSAKKQKQSQDEVIVEKEKQTSLAIAMPSCEKGEDMGKIKNVYHRKDGRWEYRRTRNGIVEYAIANSKELLLKRMKNLRQREKKKSEFTGSADSFIGWTELWLKTFKTNQSPSTMKNYQNIIKNYMPGYFKNTKMSDLTPIFLQGFLNTFDVNSRLFDYAYLTMKQSLKHAYINSKTSRNLAEMIIKPRKKKKYKNSALSLEEQTKFLECLKVYDQDVQIFMMFSLIAGTRRTETATFSLQDIDEKKNRIMIHGTKTDNAERTIKVSPDFVEFLKSKAIFGKRYFTREPQYYTKIANEIFKRMGIERTLHDLRHTCSTNLHYLGWPDKERQAYLGHASIVMTNDIYTNLQEDIDESGLLKLYNNLYPRI